MYRPPAFREDRPEILHEAIRAHPLGTLITAGPSGLVANVVPFTLAAEPEGAVLRAHLAKANQQIADLRAGTPALILFQGPHGYISPSWYATKREHGKEVPTWNYVIVQARGIPRIHDDRQWLRAQIGELTHDHEGARAEPWQVSDAPDDYVEALLKGIVGLEIPVDQIEGKWKVSQNQPERNQTGIVQGLRDDGHDRLAAEVIARGKAR
jgi:transcriptional regulator